MSQMMSQRFKKRLRLRWCAV